MNTRQNDQDWNDLLSDYNFQDDFDVDPISLSDSDEVELPYDSDAANEDYWDVLCNNDEEWEAATAEGFLIF